MTAGWPKGFFHTCSAGTLHRAGRISHRFFPGDPRAVEIFSDSSPRVWPQARRRRYRETRRFLDGRSGSPICEMIVDRKRQ